MSPPEHSSRAGTMADGPAAARPAVDLTAPHPARVYDYLLGGKDNFAVDRELADAMIAELPQLPAMIRAHRRFLERATRHLATEAGLRQFVHVGYGLPSSYDLHQVAQETDPSARVVYVDSDPVVAAHARALLVGDPKGAVAFVLGDECDPLRVFTDPTLTAAVDLGLPLGIGLSTLLLNRPDDDVRALLGRLFDLVAPGSHLVVTHQTTEFGGAAAAAIGRTGGLANPIRSRDEVAALLGRWEPIEPGVVPILGWRPDGLDAERDERAVHLLGAVARRP
jgi:hypothetical protein